MRCERSILLEKIVDVDIDCFPKVYTVTFVSPSSVSMEKQLTNLQSSSCSSRIYLVLSEFSTPLICVEPYARYIVQQGMIHCCFVLEWQINGAGISDPTHHNCHNQSWMNRILLGKVWLNQRFCPQQSITWPLFDILPSHSIEEMMDRCIDIPALIILSGPKCNEKM